MTPCKQIAQLLCKQLDGEITAEEKHRIDDHLSSCEACTETARSLTYMSEQLRQLPRVQASEEFQILLRDRIRKSRTGHGPKWITFPLLPRWTFIPATGLALAAIVLISRPYFNKTNSAPFSSEGTTVAEYMNTGTPGQVHYVMEDNPESVMLSRDDTGRMRRDSTHAPRKTSIGQRAGAVQVSF